MNGQTNGIGTFTHHLKTFLIVGSSTSNPNFNLVCFQIILKGCNSLNKTRECCSNISKVSNTTSNNKNFAFRVQVSSHETNQGFCIFVGMFCGRCSTIFSIISQLAAKSQVRNGICIDHTCSTTGNHGPNASLMIQNRKFEGRTRLAVQFSNIRFFWKLLSSKGCWKVDMTTPLGCIQKGGRLIQFGSQIECFQLIRRGVVDDGINFHIGKVQETVYFEKCHGKGGHQLLSLFRMYTLDQTLCENLFHRRFVMQRNDHTGCLGIDITHINTTLSCK
mmetsp:Transcript_38792/g.57693  ORF Transcript_38792/g.57693 Transcript_38792/m.57693 type:complete len:276 (-) Transcript_38792:522-1349(-)